MPFEFRLELTDGEPADPPTFATNVPSWAPGDQIFIRPGLVYRVTNTREGVLVVERE